MNDSVQRRWSSRKLWVAATLWACILVLLLLGHISETTFQILTMFVWGGYLAGNIGEYLARR